MQTPPSLHTLHLLFPLPGTLPEPKASPRPGRLIPHTLRDSPDPVFSRTTHCGYLVSWFACLPPTPPPSTRSRPSGPPVHQELPGETGHESGHNLRGRTPRLVEGQAADEAADESSTIRRARARGPGRGPGLPEWGPPASQTRPTGAGESAPRPPPHRPRPARQTRRLRRAHRHRYSVLLGAPLRSASNSQFSREKRPT